MDRGRAVQNVKSGLLAAAIAVGCFGLTFIVALLYIS
jgi:hypothetical protein